MSEQHFQTPGLRGLEITIPAGDVDVTTIDGDAGVLAEAQEMEEHAECGLTI